ncbi:hypothetical protein JOD54_003906 [Actinokineospora baliensis]|uniref:hypothetical protein n=1 Tax=Actinokineospora baliensis TaxID=547056 RepID=UPI00195DD06A|nr:hypothetical protein [Actinokineospora baliensis]MBM7773702.1 hypothetical protein [Actinokineospora baliensis]
MAQVVAAVVLVGAAVVLFVLAWGGVRTASGYDGEPGVFEVDRCTSRSTPDGDVHRCTGAFRPDGSTAPSGTVVLDPARESHERGAQLTARRVGDQVFVPSEGITAVQLVFIAGALATLVGLGGYLVYLAVRDDEWRIGVAVIWALVASAVAAGLALAGVLTVLVVG